MFFVLSKIIHYLFQPLVLVLLLFFLSYVKWLKPWRKQMRVGAIVILLFFSNEFIANEVMRFWELPGVRYEQLKKYEVAVILTGITETKSNGPDDRVYFNTGADRLIHGVELYKKGIVKMLLISGGSGQLIDDGSRESVKLKSVALMMGVPDSLIIVDTNSDNTHENAVESKKVLDSLKIKTADCLLVTSAFHMRRSLACFRKVNASMDYFTCDFKSHPRSLALDVLFVPSLDALMIWQRLIKEWVGLVAYRVAGYI